MGCRPASPSRSLIGAITCFSVVIGALVLKHLASKTL
jgi:hypothetical protein